MYTSQRLPGDAHIGTIFRAFSTLVTIVVFCAFAVSQQISTHRGGQNGVITGGPKQLPRLMLCDFGNPIRPSDFKEVLTSEFELVQAKKLDKRATKYFKAFEVYEPIKKVFCLLPSVSQLKEAADRDADFVKRCLTEFAKEQGLEKVVGLHQLPGFSQKLWEELQERTGAPISDSTPICSSGFIKVERNEGGQKSIFELTYSESDRVVAELDKRTPIEPLRDTEQYRLLVAKQKPGWSYEMGVLTQGVNFAALGAHITRSMLKEIITKVTAEFDRRLVEACKSLADARKGLSDALFGERTWEGSKSLDQLPNDTRIRVIQALAAQGVSVSSLQKSKYTVVGTMPSFTIGLRNKDGRILTGTYELF